MITKEQYDREMENLSSTVNGEPTLTPALVEYKVMSDEPKTQAEWWAHERIKELEELVNQARPDAATSAVARTDLLAFEVWREGFLCTGMEGIPEKASFEGIVYGESFADACNHWAMTKDPAYFDKDRLTYWGCRLFDNERDARKFLG